MDDLLARLESLGRPGGFAGLGLSVVLAALGVWLLAQWFDPSLGPLLSRPAEESWSAFWVPRLVLGGGLLALGAAAFSGVMGFGLLTQRQYPKAEEVFPPMEVPAIVEALQNRTENQCVCTRCRVMVPAAFSTGACPVCASSVEYHEVGTEEDAQMVISALG